MSLGELKRAKEYHEGALAIRQQTLGPQHPEVPTSFNNLANVIQGDVKVTSLHFWRHVTITKIRVLLIVLVVRKNMRLSEKAMQRYREW